MRKLLLTAVSAMTIVTAAPVSADTSVKSETSAEVGNNEMSASEAAKVQQDDAVLTEQELEQGWENTKENVSEAAESVSDATAETYQDIKAAVIGEGDVEMQEGETLTISQRSTANYMIGQPVYNPKGERVALINDIILDRDGQAIMVVLGDGNFTGLGKNVAFDYSMLTKTNEKGEVVVSLTEDMIEKAQSFSYDREDYSESVRVIPSNGYSVNALLDANVVGPQGKVLGDVENIAMENGMAKSLIVGVNEVLGLGGSTIAVPFKNTEIVKDGDAMNFKISSQQRANLDLYKNN